MASAYGQVHAKSVGDMVELRFKFLELQARREQEDREEGRKGPETTNKLSAVRFKLDK